MQSLYCPKCKEVRTVIRRSIKRNRFQCKEKGHYFTLPSQTRAVKIGVCDIETLPMKVYQWSPYSDYASPTQVIQDWCLLSWSFKWLFDTEVMGDVLTPEEAKNYNDRRISKSLWELVDEADIIIFHNGRKFDRRKMNSRFKINGLPPPMPFRLIDTYEEAKDTFGFSYNKLDWLSKTFGSKGKQENSGWPLWIACAEGNKASLKEMLDYNKVDVLELETVYAELLPWMNKHPNLALYSVTNSDGCCSRCLTKITKKDISGRYPTPQNMYLAYRCPKCSAVGRTNIELLTSAERKNIYR